MKIQGGFQCGGHDLFLVRTQSVSSLIYLLKNILSVILIWQRWDGSSRVRSPRSGTVETKIFSGVDSKSTVEYFKSISEIRAFKSDTIIALGGGSVRFL